MQGNTHAVDGEGNCICESCSGYLAKNVPFCTTCGRRFGQQGIGSILKITLLLVFTLVAVLVGNAAVIFYLLITSTPPYLFVLVTLVCVITSILAISLLGPSDTFRFWAKVFHRYGALRRSVFLFTFYIFSLSFVLVTLPALQSLFPQQVQAYAFSLAIGASAFIFAGAVWSNLNTTCRTWLFISRPKSSKPEKLRLFVFTLDRGRSAFYIVTLLISVAGAWYILEALKQGTTAIVSTYLAVLVALFIGEYFLWNLWSMTWKLFGLESYTPYARQVFKYAWFALPYRILVGGSSTIEAQITPLPPEKTGTVNKFLEVEVQSAGVKHGSDQKQRKPSEIDGDPILYYTWNCQFPQSGDHTIDVYCRVTDVVGVKHETLFTHRVKVTSGKSTFLLTLLPVIYGALNVAIALKKAGVF